MRGRFGIGRVIGLLCGIAVAVYVQQRNQWDGPETGGQQTITGQPADVQVFDTHTADNDAL